MSSNDIYTFNFGLNDNKYKTKFKSTTEFENTAKFGWDAGWAIQPHTAEFSIQLFDETRLDLLSSEKILQLFDKTRLDIKIQRIKYCPFDKNAGFDQNPASSGYRTSPNNYYSIPKSCLKIPL